MLLFSIPLTIVADVALAVVVTLLLTCSLCIRRCRLLKLACLLLTASLSVYLLATFCYDLYSQLVNIPGRRMPFIAFSTAVGALPGFSLSTNERSAHRFILHFLAAPITAVAIFWPVYQSSAFPWVT